jgi:hypothetical protein
LNNNNNNNKEDESTKLQENPYTSIESSFESMTIYKKRIIKGKYFSVSTSQKRIDSNRTGLFRKRNTYTKNQLKQFNNNKNYNYNINTFNNSYSNTSPYFNNFNYYSTKTESYRDTITNNFNNINNNKDNKISNSVINNVKKKLISVSKANADAGPVISRTSNNSKDKTRDLMYYSKNNDEGNSDINIRYTQCNSNRNHNIYRNLIKSHYDKRIYDYSNNLNYEKNNNKVFNDNYQTFSFVHQKKNKIKNRILNNTFYNVKINIKNLNEKKMNRYNDYDNFIHSVDDLSNKKSDKNILITINIEDIIILVEKINEIIYLIKNRKEVKKQCYEFWNYFFNLNLYQKIEKICKNEKDIKIIRIAIYSQLVSIMLCYEFSFDKYILIKTFSSLLEILELNYCNLMLICQNIVNKISKENKVNEWVLKLNKVIHNSNKNEGQNNQNKANLEKMSFINETILIKINKILLYYKTECSSLIMNLLKKIKEKTYEQINDFFQGQILRKDNNNKNNQKKTLFLPVRFSCVLSKRMKPYTLVIMEKAIINCNFKNNKQNVIKFRPFLIEFLEILNQYYELILYSFESLKNIASIIKTIQQKKKLFRLCFL